MIGFQNDDVMNCFFILCMHMQGRFKVSTAKPNHTCQHMGVKTFLLHTHTHTTVFWAVCVLETDKYVSLVKTAKIIMITNFFLKGLTR